MPDATRHRWPLYTAAILAGRALPAEAHWWPELAPLTHKERFLVFKTLSAERREGAPAALPSEPPEPMPTEEPTDGEDRPHDDP